MSTKDKQDPNVDDLEIPDERTAEVKGGVGPIDAKTALPIGPIDAIKAAKPIGPIDA